MKRSQCEISKRCYILHGNSSVLEEIMMLASSKDNRVAHLLWKCKKVSHICKITQDAKASALSMCV